MLPSFVRHYNLQLYELLFDLSEKLHGEGGGARVLPGWRRTKLMKKHVVRHGVSYGLEVQRIGGGSSGVGGSSGGGAGGETDGGGESSSLSGGANSGRADGRADGCANGGANGRASGRTSSGGTCGGTTSHGSVSWPPARCSGGARLGTLALTLPTRRHTTEPTLGSGPN